jgi:hypothetical protein
MSSTPGSSLVSGNQPSIGRMADEGLLITLSAVRMAVKNSIIVTALREKVNFAEADYAAIARTELRALSKRNTLDAERVERQRKRLSKTKWSLSFSDDSRQDIVLLAKRRKVYERLAEALAAVAEDEEQVTELVAAAQGDAGAELGAAVSARLIDQAKVPTEPDYQEKREDRMRDLVNIDLAMLKATKTVPIKKRALPPKE